MPLLGTFCRSRDVRGPSGISLKRDTACTSIVHATCFRLTRRCTSRAPPERITNELSDSGDPLAERGQRRVTGDTTGTDGTRRDPSGSAAISANFPRHGASGSAGSLRAYRCLSEQSRRICQPCWWWWSPPTTSLPPTSPPTLVSSFLEARGVR